MYHSFEDLDVWKRGCSLAVKLHVLLKTCREQWLRDQILRAALSIPSNVAEGAERTSRTEFKRFLAYAKASAAELRTQFYIAIRIGIFDKTTGTALVHETKKIAGMLHNLAHSVSKGAALSPKTSNLKP